MIPGDDPSRIAILVELAEQLAEIGDFTSAKELVAGAEDDPVWGPHATLTRLAVMMRTDPAQAMEEGASVLPGLFERLTRERDFRGLAKAHLLAEDQHRMDGQAALAREQAKLVAEFAAKAGDEGLRARALGMYMAGLLAFGALDDRTISHEIDEIELGGPGPYVQAFIDCARGEVCRLRTDFSNATRLINRGIDGFEALGLEAMAGAAGHLAGLTLISAGDSGAAVEALQRSDSTLKDVGDRSLRSSSQAFLAWAYSMVPDRAAALAACDLCDELTAPGNVLNLAMTHRVRAKLARDDGDLVLAEEQARLAIGHAYRMDSAAVQATARLELAHVLSGLGRANDATTEARAALELYEACGDRGGMGWAQTLLAEL